MINVFTSTRINKQETEKGIYFQIYTVRSKTNEDTLKPNTLLRQNGASKDSSKKFGSGYQPSENRYGYDNEVQGSKRRKKTENWLNQDFSQDKNDVKKNKKATARALARKRYSTTKIKARNF